MKKIHRKEFVIILLGNFILAFGVSCFILPNDVLTGGVAGIAVALKVLIFLDPRIIINVLTILLFIIGIIFLGKDFTTKTVVSTISYPIMLWGLQGIPASTFLMDPLLATIYGGICMGIGVGLVFHVGASTGGMDIPPLIVHKYTHITLPILVMITDALTVLLGLSTYGIEKALTGIISVWISSVMIDKVLLLGTQNAKEVMIISDVYQEVFTQIHNRLERGSTIFQAKGGFSQKDKPVIMVVVVKKQLPLLQHLIEEIDKEAFVIIHDVNKVQGLGFTYDDF